MTTDPSSTITIALGSAEGADGWVILADILGSTAWPIAAVAMAWVFRREMRGLLGKITKLSFMGVDSTFGERIEKAETASADVSVGGIVGGIGELPAPSPPISGEAPLANADRTHRHDAGSAPTRFSAEFYRSKVLAAHTRLMDMIFLKATEVGWTPEMPEHPVTYLADRSIISKRQVPLVLELDLAAIAARTDSITPSDAVRYLNLATPLTKTLEMRFAAHAEGKMRGE